MNIDKLILKEQKRRAEGNSLHLILEMIDEVLEQAIPLHALLSERENLKTTSQTFTLDLIPLPTISEIGWGHLASSEGNEADGFRTELASYLKNISGTDLRAKLQTLNRFFDGEMEPTDFTSASDKISKIISYLVFYRTLTEIVVGFNPSAAGFAFESFVAVLIDAKTGRQVPAAGASTIADVEYEREDNPPTSDDDKSETFPMEGATHPISLKLYAEAGLEVGGSLRQLMQDLLRKPIMEYILVTKDFTGGDALKKTGALKWMAFNFTLDNVIDILYYVGNAKYVSNLILPKQFQDADIENKFKDPQFLKSITIPEPGTRTHTIYYEYFNLAFEEALLAQGIPKEEIDELVDLFYATVINPVDGTWRTATSSSFIPSTQAQFKKLPSVFTDDKKKIRSRYQGFVEGTSDLVLEEKAPPSTEEVNKQLLVLDALSNAMKRYKKFGASTPKNKERNTFKAELYDTMDAKISYELLADFRKKNKELYKFALAHTKGALDTGSRFSLSGASLGKNMGKVDQTNLYPYGNEYIVGKTQIGRETVEDVLQSTVNNLNAAIFEIFTSLKTLTDSLNKYVSDGMKDGNVAKQAQDAAKNIDKKTEQVMKGDVPDAGKYNFSRGKQPGSTGKRVPGGRGIREQKEYKKDEVIID